MNPSPPSKEEIVTLLLGDHAKNYKMINLKIISTEKIPDAHIRYGGRKAYAIEVQYTVEVIEPVSGGLFWPYPNKKGDLIDFEGQLMAFVKENWSGWGKGIDSNIHMVGRAY